MEVLEESGSGMGLSPLSTKSDSPVAVIRCSGHPGIEMTRETYGLRCSACISDDLHAFYLDLEEKRQFLAKKRTTAEIDTRFADIQIGKRFRGLTWDDYRPTCEQAQKIKAFCLNYAKGFGLPLNQGSSLVFSGNVGTGKNMLSALIAEDVVSSGHTALHTTVLKMVRRIRSTWGGHGDEQTMIDSFVLPDLLIVDEIGNQAGSDDEVMRLTEVFNDRYEAKKSTILLTNLSAAELPDYLGSRVMDRLCERGRIVPFTWESYRQRRS